MHNEYFLLDGLSSLENGIRLQKPISFTGAVPSIEKQHITGRSGDVLIYDTSYHNVTGTASCFALSMDNVANVVAHASGFLLGTRGYRRLETSNEPDYFRLACVANGPRLEDRIRRLAPFEIEFDCKPQKWLKTGEQVTKLTAPGSIFNPTPYDALPLITVRGTGECSVAVNTRKVKFTSLDDEITIDCETGEAYHITTDDPRDAVTVGYIFPALFPGENAVSWDGGVTSVEIVPRFYVL